MLLDGDLPERAAMRLCEELCARDDAPRVVMLLAEGAGRREVAEQLHLSANTVRTHLQNLMAKLGVHSTLEAVALSRPHLEQLRPSS